MNKTNYTPAVVDLSELKERLDGDKVVFLEVAELFFENYDEEIETMGNAIRSADFDKLNQCAHSLKGSLGNLSAISAAEEAFKLEKMALHRDISGAAETFENLKTYVSLYKKFVEDVKAGRGWD